MSNSVLRVVSVLTGLLLVPQAWGNGALASFPAGGVVFEDSADIALVQEDLFLSPSEVRVHYLFNSDADDAQTVTIGFPLPRVPATPDEPDSVQSLEGEERDIRNYLRFGVTVNGEVVTPILHEFAWLGDRDVSAEVLAAGLSLLPTFEETTEWTDIDRATAASLMASGLLAGELGSYVYPAWDYQVVYEWQQDFAVGATEVDIRYNSLMGWPGDFGDVYEVGAHAATACVDDALREKIAAMKSDNFYYEVAQLDYVTTTAQHWAGPIGTFNLTVSPQGDEDWLPSKPGQVLTAMCPADTPADANGNRHWSARNYVPEKDVRVFFYIFSSQD